VPGIKALLARALAACAASLAWQQCFYFLSLPQGQGSLRVGVVIDGILNQVRDEN